MKSILIRIILFPGLCFLNIAPGIYAQDPNFHIYLCFGQSNMEGVGTIELLDYDVDSRFKVMQAVNCSNRFKGSWYTAVPPLCRCNNGLSPVDYFGRTMIENLDTDIKVGIINISVAGCKIELFDKDSYQEYISAVTQGWLLDIINIYGGNPYAYLVGLAKQAQNDGVIKGILLHQGEANDGDFQWPAKVKKIYNDLMVDLELDPHSVPLLAGELVHTEQGGIHGGMNSIIGTLPSTLANSYVISSKACTDEADNLHFNSAGYRELGMRYAKQMLAVMGFDTSDIIYPKIPFPPGETTIGSITDNGYLLRQNFPNPFTKETNLSFSIPMRTYVSLRIYNMYGVEVTELLGKEVESGKHTISFNASELPEGNYYYIFKSENNIRSGIMTIIKN